MTERNWSTNTQSKIPVSWNGITKTFSIVFSGIEGRDDLEAEWAPPVTYVVRIREANNGGWSFGFETPLTGCGFVDLKPDTEYEIEVRSKNATGEGDPAVIRVRTSPDGSLGI